MPKPTGTFLDTVKPCKPLIGQHGYILTPGRCVGAEDVEDDQEPLEQKMRRLTTKLREQQAMSQHLDDIISKAMGVLGYGK